MSYRVLVVEDDPDGQEMISHIIGHIDLAYDVVSNAEDAWQYLVSAPNDYVAAIIDLSLPGKDGWELLTDIRNNPNTQMLKCIAMTAFHSSKARGEALRMGFDGYFPKPINILEFIDLLEMLI